ncbi:hypothetical protein CC2G_008007 [Coprinopsis cinerea AmutBmut pab1-1]|nr:hypothetical protein CC2G_008007 [Coprinopsis cinerea AmutBmut pab1-1]
MSSSSTTTTTPKERHYWAQLRQALVAGQWLAESPAKAPNGALLSWSEAFRKFGKHGIEAAGVGAEARERAREFKEVASQVYALAVVLATTSLNEDEEYPPGEEGRWFGLEVGEECVVPDGRREEVIHGYEVLKGLERNEEVRHALVYYAYALGRPEECLQHLERWVVPEEVEPSLPLLPTPTTGLADGITPEVRDGRGMVLTMLFRSVCLKGMSIEKLYPDQPERALDVYREAQPLFKILTTNKEFRELVKGPVKTPPDSNPAKRDYSNFVRYREMWRWVERIIWRGVCLSARIEDVCGDGEPGEAGEMKENDLWMWLEKYTITSRAWPPNFRTDHRATVSAVYLRALVLRRVCGSGLSADGTGSADARDGKSVSSKASASRASLLTNGTTNAGSGAPGEVWLDTALSVIHELKAILTVSTQFPRAGERNTKVEEFVDLCGCVWEASLSSSPSSSSSGSRRRVSWFTEILWWSTRLTFNSSRVLRWMVKVFYVTGEVGLARRCARLYVNVVGKAWVTGRQGAADSDKEGKEEGYYGDVDSDAAWVQTLIYAARMICREVGRRKGLTPGALVLQGGSAHAAATGLGVGAAPNLPFVSGGHGKEGAVGGGAGGGVKTLGKGGKLEDLREARELLGRAKERFREGKSGTSTTGEEALWRRLRAEMYLAEGICDGLEGVLGPDEERREELLRREREVLEKSVEVWEGQGQSWFMLGVAYMRGAPAVASASASGTGASAVRGVGEGVGSTQALNGDGRAVKAPVKRDLEKALVCAAKAVECRPRDVRAWHLLGLVFAAMEKWEEAEEALERGEAVGRGVVGEEEDEDDEEGEEGQEDYKGEGEEKIEKEGRGRREERASSSSFALDIPVGGKEVERVGSIRVTAVPRSARFVPFVNAPNRDDPEEVDIAGEVLKRVYNPLARVQTSASSGEGASLVQVRVEGVLGLGDGDLFPGHPLNMEEEFEEGLEVRMTKMKVREVREGPEGVASQDRGWVEVFAWVAEQKLGRGISGSQSIASTTGGTGGVQGSGTGSGLGHAAGRAPSVLVKRQSFDGAVSQISVTALHATTARVSNGEGVVREEVSIRRTSVISVGSTAEGGARSVQGRTEEGRGVQGEEDDGFLHVPAAGIGITISPASPVEPEHAEEKGLGGRKRSSSSVDREFGGRDGNTSGNDTSKSKKMQQKLKSHVHKSSARISAVGKRIGHGVGEVVNTASGNALGVVGLSGRIRRSSSAPDFHKVLQQQTVGGLYQASSIHSRKRVLAPSVGSRDGALSPGGGVGTFTPDLPGTPMGAGGVGAILVVPAPGAGAGVGGVTGAGAAGAGAAGGGGVGATVDVKKERENRLMSDLWLMSAATFRRLGKIDAAKGAIQEAEVRDEHNTGVWVQLALYYVALGHYQHAIATLQKALFIDPDDVPAIVHLARLYLQPPPVSGSPYHRSQQSQPQTTSSGQEASDAKSVKSTSTAHEEPPQPPCAPEEPVPSSTDVDLACALLTQSSRGRGWDVPEVWYFLAKAYKYQGRKEREGEALRRALELSEGRGVREVGDAIGLCL